MSARLRVNVFTPLPPAHTDIANVNLPIISLMQDVADVTVWTPQEYWDPLEDRRIRVHPFRADAIAFWDLNAADVNIFHIGNNREMHEDIFDVARRVPGLVVLHDVNLHDFSLEMYHAGRLATYAEIMTRCHGVAALDEARHALAHGGMGDVMKRYPCTMAPAARATGILMHNRSAATALAAETSVPVFFLPLPFADRDWPEPSPRPAARKPYRLVAFGFLGKNRRVEQILHVLADSPMRDNYTLDIYGMFHDPEALEALIEEYDLGDIVSVHGFVSFQTLNAAIAAADLVLNLRNPTVGEASGSQLRIWANGAASVVTDHGWYADLPSDCVQKIDAESEADDLMHLLIDFCCRPDHYHRMGEAGLRHVRATHDARDYVSALMQILQGERERQRATLARALTQRFRKPNRPDTLLAERAVLALFGADVVPATREPDAKTDIGHDAIQSAVG